MSPIDSPNPNHLLSSPYSLSPHPIAMSPSALLHQHSSNLSLHELVTHEAEQERLRAAGAFSDAPDEAGRYEELADQHVMPRVRESSEAGPSNRHIHLVSYPSDGSVSQMGSRSHPYNNNTPPSPSGSNSGESEYSLPDDSMETQRAVPNFRRNELLPREMNPKPRQPSARSSERPRGLVDTDGKLDVLLDPSFEEWAHQRVWADGGGEALPSPTAASSGALGNGSPRSPNAPEQWHTPTSSLFERRRHMSPSTWNGRTPSPGQQDDRTPRNSTQTLRGSGSRLSGPKGRTLFISPDVPRRSLDELERDVQELSLHKGSPRPAINLDDDADLPHSAPPHKTSFGDLESAEDKRRPTSLLPSVQMPSPDPSGRSTQLSPPGSDPVGLERRSPEPPPRSERRKQ